ncbi:MAG: TorF family putative porin [Syntrophobacteraceae bacterium]
MNLPTFYKKWLLCTALVYLIFFSCLMPAGAEEPKAPEESAPKLTATVGADVLSQYIFRGVALSNDSAVIQPSVTVAYAGFALNMWGNFDTEQRNRNPNLVGFVKRNGKPVWNETDFTFSYTREIFKDFSLTGGTIYYVLNNARFNAQELYLGATYTLPWFTVAFTSYREISHTPGWWLQLDLTKSIPLPIFCEGTSLDLSASLGYQIFNDEDTTLDLAGRLGDYSEFHSATLGAGLKIPVWKTVTITPKIGVALPLTGASSNFIEGNSFDKDDTHVFGGINIAASF